MLGDFAAGKPAALARVVSIVENRRAGFEAILATLHPKLGRAWRVGLTGPPGAGKSTLTMRLTSAYREAGKRVGVVAVDPTSPFTGGALLGDRIRMESVALDPGVFIRSMATRGSLGGLASATREVADVLDAFGIDVILIETVGVGQTELDIARTADTSIVVLVPESGDSIQTLKAGLMEIADIYVVNKADRPGADRLRNELELMLGLRAGSSMRDVPAHHGVDLRSLATTEEKRALNPARAAREAARSDDAARWTPPVLRTVAAQGEGIAELLDAVDRHMRFLERSGELRERRARRLRERVIEVAERLLRGRLWGDAATMRSLDAALPGLETGATSPFAVAETLLANAATVVAGTTDR
ncbi:MAG: methylmalonyl Co-A mutase-associated GTPase MeaB [Gemmatimonadaceae bacterium]|nr:methylmalonyl Co-A mutase-associated GTPase MeaB [Gemmatimonadaceae bacterium]NUQ92022.1 methylmalonyl Co-A mutase-associated GTPase MeaB [Gemmatimonadaceae bacterium]NUR19134.1 methylmalonyl Co-A mutase-associated GTPase MeaB [Gemmatimonadaceae bacterium]